MNQPMVIDNNAIAPLAPQTSAMVTMHPQTSAPSEIDVYNQNINNLEKLEAHEDYMIKYHRGEIEKNLEKKKKIQKQIRETQIDKRARKKKTVNDDRKELTYRKWKHEQELDEENDEPLPGKCHYIDKYKNRRCTKDAKGEYEDKEFCTAHLNTVRDEVTKALRKRLANYE